MTHLNRQARGAVWFLAIWLVAILVRAHTIAGEADVTALSRSAVPGSHSRRGK